MRVWRVIILQGIEWRLSVLAARSGVTQMIKGKGPERGTGDMLDNNVAS